MLEDATQIGQRWTDGKSCHHRLEDISTCNGMSHYLEDHQGGAVELRAGLRGIEHQEDAMGTTTLTRIGWVLSGLYVLFMLGASVMPKLVGMQVAEDTMTQLGWPTGYVLMIGLIELALVLLYIWPKTSVLGTVLTMGLLGGAMATQIRAGNPLFSHILFSTYLGLFMWGGLWLRDPALRALFPFRRS